MKNLLIYINPNKKFSPEHEDLTRIQIDNSLALGWNLNDLLLVTNFKYKHNGVESLVVGDENYCEFGPCGSKIYAIVTLFEKGLIGQDLYWFHDDDAFQLQKDINPKLHKKEFGMVAYDGAPLGLRNYVGANRWNSGSIFFKNSASDIFNSAKLWMQDHLSGEERAFMKIQIHDSSFMDRTKMLNSTYNFMPSSRIGDFESRYPTAKKPIKIVHFDPFNNSQNRLSQAVVSKALMNLFNKYQIRNKL